MRTVPELPCPVCGRSGRERYPQLEDRLFGAPGTWRMVGCEDHRCATLWLDPAPDPDHLAQAYRSYYTHTAGPVSRSTWRKRVIETYVHRRLGYPAPERPARLLAAFVTLLPRYRELALFARLYLPCVQGGRLLDVGCGAGNQLAELTAAGWLAEGLEVDAAAVRAARSRGLKVTEGDLLQTPLAQGAFDAVSMIHVLEHLPQPQRHLIAARRLLRPGGRLVVVTPNAAALGHRFYREHWRGLEPPRHLQIFTPASLSALVRDSGFDLEVSSTSARDAAHMFAASAALRKAHLRQTACANSPAPSLGMRLAGQFESFAAALQIAGGEEIVMVATSR